MLCASITSCTCARDLQPLQLGRRPGAACDMVQAPRVNHPHAHAHDQTYAAAPGIHAHLHTPVVPVAPQPPAVRAHQAVGTAHGDDDSDNEADHQDIPRSDTTSCEQQQQQQQQHPLRAAERGGRVVGDYVLGRTLGVGASGKVKFATHLITGQPVAIKIIRKSLLDSKPALAAKIQREIAVLKLLGGAAAQRNCTNNVGVLALFDVYETEQCILLILEYCPGGDLFEVLLDCGYLSYDDALNAFQQLVYALYFCHRQGVAHRDLKLENILLDAKGRLKLADFGMASLMTPGSLLETACGSPNYCAPEVLAGGLYNGARSDTWSLGIILYAMVTGGLPFDDDNFSRLLAKIRAGAYHMPEAVDPQIASLISAMLRVNPEERITLADIMASPWFQSRPPSPHPPTAGSNPRSEAACYSFPILEQSRSSSALADPIVDPYMPFVMHLTHLGLGDIPTIVRRLRSKRSCIEKDFYTRIGCFVSQPISRSIAAEVPPSPGVGPTRDSLLSPRSGHDVQRVWCPPLADEDKLPGCILP
jgi:serine/threonine protein kinase